jgi:MFS family permease
MLLLMTAMQMQMVVRSYLTYEITSSPFLLGLVNAGFAIPMLSLSLFGGAIADRVERKRIIQIGQSVAVVLSLIIAVSIATDTVTWMHLLGVSMAQGALFSFLMPARQAMIPQLVGKENLTNAMSLDAAAMSGTTLIAPAIGGGLYNVIGPDGVYYLIAGCGVLAIVFTSAVNAPPRDRSQARKAMLSDIKSGLIYVAHSRMLVVLLALGLVTTLLAMPFRFIMPVFVVDVYNKGPESMGLLVTITGVGALVGSLWIASIGKWHRGLLILGSGLLSGIALMLVASIPIYFAAAGIMILLGLGDSVRQTLNQAMVMEETDDEFRGRVMSIFMMIFGLMPLGVLPAGALAEWMGGQFAIGVMAGLLILVTTVLLITQKQLRNHQ